MDLLTHIPLPPAGFSFSYEDRIVLMGSCFAEHIGQKLEDDKFMVDINPFGTLYNPCSVAEGIRRLLQPTPYMATDLYEHEGLYHSFAHHSRFSATSAVECLKQINERLEKSAGFLRKATRLVITLGTAYVYRLQSNQQIVANCHKLPEKYFCRARLNPEAIVSDWEELLASLWEANPDLCILFTVSPIRHWKDGAHENQLSKSTLLLAIDMLCKSHPERIDYFPAYELMMDELRDYRFYADDMLHPSPLAISYIWQRFNQHYLTPEALALQNEWKGLLKAMRHKPFRPESEAYQRFIFQTLLKMERLNEKFPFFEIRKEIEYIKSKLK